MFGKIDLVERLNFLEAKAVEAVNNIKEGREKIQVAKSQSDLEQIRKEFEIAAKDLRFLDSITKARVVRNNLKHFRTLPLLEHRQDELKKSFADLNGKVNNLWRKVQVAAGVRVKIDFESMKLRGLEKVLKAFKDAEISDGELNALLHGIYGIVRDIKNIPKVEEF
tara:strand:+ start:122 stop:619 length:498 start_codon:yes stop_codon:yes gene_type:complete